MTTIEQLEQQLAKLPDPIDVPPRVQEIAWQKRRTLEGRIMTIHSNRLRLAELDSKIAPVEKWLTFLTGARKRLCDELLASTGPHDRKAEDRLASVKLSIMNIDRGCEYAGPMCFMGRPLADMMLSAGYSPEPGQLDVWSAGYGSITQTERLLDELKKERLDTQTRLDAELG